MTGEQAIVLAVLALFVGAFLIALAVLTKKRAEGKLKVPGIEIWVKGEDDKQTPAHAKPRPERLVVPKHTVWLAIKQKGRPDWRYNLDGKPQIYIGRREDNQINLIHDPAADTRHAVIYFENRRYYVNNLSPKGTIVNKRLVAKQMLGDSNTIQMGNTKMIFHEKRR